MIVKVERSEAGFVRFEGFLGKCGDCGQEATDECVAVLACLSEPRLGVSFPVLNELAGAAPDEIKLFDFDFLAACQRQLRHRPPRRDALQLQGELVLSEAGFDAPIDLGHGIANRAGYIAADHLAHLRVEGVRQLILHLAGHQLGSDGSHDHRRHRRRQFVVAVDFGIAQCPIEHFGYAGLKLLVAASTLIDLVDAARESVELPAFLVEKQFFQA